MATYFHGSSEIQADGLQTLIFMNPAYVNYSDTQQHQNQHHQHHQNPSNFAFLNSSGGAPNGGGYSLASPQHSTRTPPSRRAQQFQGIPVQATVAAGTHDQTHQEAPALQGFLPPAQYNLWNPIDPSAVNREASRSKQGLSLCLSSQQPGFGSFESEREQPKLAPEPAHSGEEMRGFGGSPSSASGISNGVTGIQNVLFGTKYLKAAQQVLDEVVSVIDGLSSDAAKKSNSPNKLIGGDSSAVGDSSTGGETTAKRAAELTTAERQEIQMKKAKLVGMLDEVEQRYRRYHNQMQIVISSFEQAAGAGSAKTYTSLALQTISKQFRCLKDAILGQIRSANKSLGEEDCIGGKMAGSSRLKFVDHQLRQQRAFQQLGMIQHNAWRPQRGLPERAVSVLRAWLFEHFLHPYPKDSDKQMLAKQTGLTRSQVSNWFINARVRLWKPMVEEMYLEEVKEHEQNGSADNPASKNEQNHDSESKPSALQEQMNIDMKPIEANNDQMLMKFDSERHDRDRYSMMGGPTNFIGGFGSYPIGEMTRFDTDNYETTIFSGNAVSLSLGQPDTENLSLSRTHQSFFENQNTQLGRRVELELRDSNQFEPMNGATTAAYENMNIQNRKRFAAQLLPDFVA